MSVLRVLAWILAAVNVLAGIALFLDRGGDAATRGLGRALGMLFLLLAGVAAALAWWGNRGAGRGVVLVLACLAGSLPVVLVGLFTSQRGLALIYPSLREARPQRPAPKYRFPDAATSKAALALVQRDRARFEELLRTTPAPSLTARDELGQTLLGIAVYMAVTLDATQHDVAVVERLLALGARPRADDLGGDESVLELLAATPGEQAALVLDRLLAAGLDANAPPPGRVSILYHPFLQPDAARVLLKHAADVHVRDTDPERRDWSPATVAAFHRRWETAAVLLAAGAPADYASPPGSLLAEVIDGIEPLLDAVDRAQPGYRAFMTAAGR